MTTLEDNLPENYSLFLVGPPGVGKFEYCVDKLKNFLKNDNKVIKLVGTGRMENCRCTLRCAPKVLEMDHPLSAINYSEKAISFVTDTMGRITVSGGKSSPRGAAAALLKDIIHSGLFSLKQLL